MKYTLNRTTGKTDWAAHEFYKDACVLGIDIGIDGIGIALRKGPEILFAQTFLVADTTRTLEDRRLKRSLRRSRLSRKRREKLLREWIVRHGLLSRERVDAIWHDTRVFENAFNHRLRGTKQKLGSAEALVSCLRHTIKHRGFDYHLTGDAVFPWGESFDYAGILKWAGTGCCPQTAADQWKLLLPEADFSHNEEKVRAVEAAIDDAVRRFDTEPILNILTTHLKEEKHTNHRLPARGHHFPRELIKRHVRQICGNNRDFFQHTDFDSAVRELIGDSDSTLSEGPSGCIIDFHRKTREQAARLWERKTNPCPFASALGDSLDPKNPRRCSPGRDIDVRKFKLLQFAAERTLALRDGAKHHIPEAAFWSLVSQLENDTRAIDESQPRPALRAKGLRALLEDTFSAAFEPVGAGGRKKKPARWIATKSEHNDAFLKQLLDLLETRRSDLEARSSLSGFAAGKLFDQATAGGTVFEPATVRAQWKDTYYLWRMAPRDGGDTHPHTRFLLGHRRQFADGVSNDHPVAKAGKYAGMEHPGRRKDGATQEHGVLRRLFAGQMRDPLGNPIDLSAHLGSKQRPDYVIIETIGEIPRGPQSKKAIEDAQKANRKHREELALKYSLGERPSRSSLLRAILFEQQIPEGESEAICPMTGASLGTNPLDTSLQIAHIYPNSRGGLYERLNLFITTTAVNAAMGNDQPFQCAGRTRDRITFLPWERMLALVQKRFHWGKAKRELFSKEDDAVPEWENLTRVSQLARQLKVAVEDWLGVGGPDDPAERVRSVFSKIGTPTGNMTAACRAAWRDRIPEFMRAGKSRANLRHHLYDAIVLSHIPPGTGMNFTECGGIFFLKNDRHGNEVLSAIDGLLPDLEAFEQSTREICLVDKRRKPKSKRSRAEETIYSNAFAQEDDAQVKLRVRKKIRAPVQGKDTFVPHKHAEEWLSNSGIPPEKLPRKRVEEWCVTGGERPLRLTDGTPVDSVPVSTPLKQKSSLVPHRGAQGEVIGYKIATEGFAECQIWSGPRRSKSGGVVLEKNGEPARSFLSVVIPPARNRRLFKEITGKPWRRDPDIPEDFTLLGSFKKGDVLRMPINAEGKRCPAGQIPWRFLWYRVDSIRATKRIETHLVEFDGEKLSGSPWSGLLKHYSPDFSSAKDLARLLSLNPHLLKKAG